MTTKLINAETLRTAVGGVSDMTIHRWLNDPAMNFPRPTMIRKRRYWRESDVVEWIERHAKTTAAA